MNFVEKHSKLLAVALCLCASGPILSTVHAYEVQPGWHDDGTTAYYITEDHERATGITEINDETYYFGADGVMKTGFVNDGNTIFYFGNNGRAVKGLVEIQGMAFNFQDDGTLIQGWNEDSYYNEKGFKQTETWIQDGGSKYYVDEEGSKIADSTASIQGNEYYFDPQGRTVVGTFSLDDKDYQTDDQGIIQKNVFIDNGDAIVFATEDGSINKEPVLEVEGTVYAFEEDGSLILDQKLPEKPEIIETQTPEEPAEIFVPEQAEPVLEMEQAPAAEPIAVDVYQPDIYTPEIFEEILQEQSTFDEGAKPQPEPEYIPESEPEYIPESEPEYIPEPGFQDEIPVIEEPVEESDPFDAYDNQEFDAWVQEDYGSSGSASAILAAAYAQIGIHQDCTSMVSNALASIGIDFYGWPDEYAALGTYTSNPVPGDLIIYSGHIAVYAGDGMAVHGGWNGYDTALAPVNCSNALIGYVHIG